MEKGCGRVKLGRMWGLWLTPGVADRAARSSDQKVLGAGNGGWSVSKGRTEGLRGSLGAKCGHELRIKRLSEGSY